jgi:putative inorganic carbon (hco3(-)) transporter
MATRAVRRPRWHTWALLGLAAAVLIDKTSPARFEGHWLVLTPLLVVAGVLTIRWMWTLPPAVTMCGAIALTIFSGSWQQMGLGGLPFDRLLLAIALLQFLLLAPGVAHSPRPQVRNVHLLMCLTLIYALGSAIASGTLTTQSGFLALVDLFGVAPYLAYLLAPAIFVGPRERNLLLATLTCVGAYLGLTAIFESLGPHSLVFPHYIVRVDAELPGERAGGPFQSSLAEGFANFSCAVAAAIAYSVWEGRHRRILAACVAIICLFGAFVTLERGVWIAGVVGVIATALATRAGRRWLIPGLLIGALVIVGVLAISPELERKASNRANDQVSVWDRENQTYAGLRMLAARPLFGFGWERYRSEGLEYFRESDIPMYGYTPGNAVPGEKPLPLHDTYLAYAVEIGLVGTLLWLATMIWGVGASILSAGSAELQPWKLGLIAIAVFFVVVAVFNPYQEPFPVLLLWVWAGVARGAPSLSTQVASARLSTLMSGGRGWLRRSEIGAA